MVHRDAAYMQRQKGNLGTPEAMQKRYDEQKAQELQRANPSGFKKGGVVKKTGMAKVHKGEKIIPAKSKPRRK